MNKANLSLTIRAATPQDALHLSTLCQEGFKRSHPSSYDQSEMDAYLNEHFSEAKITEDLKVSTIHYYVAQTDAIVGVVKFNTQMWTPRFKGRLTFEVERLYIREDMEGRGIGSRLMAKAVEVGREKNYRIIWLSVWADNTRAIAFHERHGFVTIGDGIFTLGNAQQKYLVMQLQE